MYLAQFSKKKSCYIFNEKYTGWTSKKKITTEINNIWHIVNAIPNEKIVLPVKNTVWTQKNHDLYTSPSNESVV